MNKINRSKMMRHDKDQKGEVSLFVVIFATLLITIVTVAFVRIMIQGQQQATAADLSQSAYDSSLAGVEDAKRAILRYQTICNSGSAMDCAAAKSTLGSLTCNSSMNLLDPATGSAEVKVQVSSGGDNKFNQAYTCVTVTMDTSDYSGKLSDNESKLIPLNSGSDKYDTVEIQWFAQSDFSTGSGVSLVSGLAETPLFAQSDWLSNRPPVLRTQMMQFENGGFNLSEFDNIGVSGQSNSNTLFLYPVKTASNDVITYDFKRDIRLQKTGAPAPVSCLDNLSSGGYACTARLKMPSAIGGNPDRTAFLRLTSIYNRTSYKITLLDTTVNKVVTFKQVQPIIDSTGRADNLFRRVKARVELNADFMYPDAEITTTNAFCKDFTVTDTPDGYQNDCPD